MVPMFLARPLLGAGTGVLVYFGVRGGLLLTSESTPSPSTEALVFLELLGGLFAKSLVERFEADVRLPRGCQELIGEESPRRRSWAHRFNIDPK
jgi:hypothetical protein